MKAVFFEAIDVPEAGRAAWLAEACGGDAALRREVESLLDSDRDAASFCETPAAAMPGAAAFDAAARRLEPGRRVGRYEILAFIGAGGMGEVYRARDTRDGRDVAIKTVSSALAHPQGEARLLREARHASTLTHPNICAIHDIGDADGMPFIAMELVDGRPLSALQAGTALPLDQLLRYGIGIAAALDHAHARGVIHRDLKRANVVIAPDDRAVVLDFGLAKQAPEHDARASAESLTALGNGPVGTLSHMAPEVLQGRRADAGSDIWSLGVLLYELAAGRLPFSGRAPLETISAILTSRAAPLPRALPLALRLVIARCLEKDPANRYQRAADVRDALAAIHVGRAWPVAIGAIGTSRTVRRRAAWAAAAVLVAGAATAFALRANEAPIPAVAVMPFDHGGGADDAAHAEAMADAIAARLGASSSVRVMSAASIARTGRDPIEAGRALGAPAVVTGTLRRSAARLELDLRLVDTERGATLWSETFARGQREVLVLQADAVRALADRLRAPVAAGARERLTLVPAVRPDVYEAFLKGRYEWNQRTSASLLKAVEHFQRAIALDPAYAPAYARLADCYNLLGTVMVGSASPAHYRPLAEGAAIKALQIDPDLPEAHAALGYVRHYSWRWADAGQSFERAIALNPSAPLPRLWYANVLMSQGRFDQALQQAETARALDPFSPIVQTNLGWVQYYARQPHASVATLRHAVSLDPSYPQARWRLAVSLAYTGDDDEEARAQARELLRLTQRAMSSLAAAALVEAMTGRPAEARRLLAEIDARSRREYVSPGTIPGVYVTLGDHDAALAWMERTLREQANASVYFGVDPWADPLRGDPRYADMLRRVGLRAGPRP